MLFKCGVLMKIFFTNRGGDSWVDRNVEWLVSWFMLFFTCYKVNCIENEIDRACSTNNVTSLYEISIRWWEKKKLLGKIIWCMWAGWGTHGTVGWGTALQAVRSRVRLCHRNFSLTESFQPHCGHGVDWTSNRNEFQEYFLGAKGGRWVVLTILPPSYVSCHKIWEPQPPGNHGACPGLYRDCFTFTFMWTGLMWVKMGSVSGSLWIGDDTSRFMKG